MSIFSDCRVIRKTLKSNGLRLVAIPLEHLHSVTFSVFVGVGSRHETKEQNGISHMLEHMVFRGTNAYPSPYKLNYAIEELGGTLYGATHVDFTQYQLTLPPENLQKGFSILADVLQNPTFLGIEIERNVIKEEILESLDEDQKNIDVDEVMRKLMFADHPLGYPIAGTLESIDLIDEAQLKKHMKRFYGASNMVLCISGNVESEEVLIEATKAFEKIPRGESAKALQIPSIYPEKNRAWVQHADSQTAVRLSFPTFGVRDPKYTALQLLMRVLDDGMSTRLHQRIVDQKGLAYEVFADTDAYVDCGIVDFGITVAHQKVEETLREILRLLEDLKKEKIPAKELEKAKMRYVWSLREMLDSDESMVSFYGINALFNLNDTPQSLEKEIQNVSTEELCLITNEVFLKKNAHLACVGDIDSLNKKEIELTLSLTED